MIDTIENSGDSTVMRDPGTCRLVAPLVVALWLLAPAVARCQIYAGSESATGAVVLSNFRTASTADLVEGTTLPVEPAAPRAVPAPVAPAPVAARPLSAELRTLVDTVASRNQLSPALIHAVIAAESRYDAKAVSAKGAIGLMQLLPATGRRFGARDLFSAEQNVTAGAGYLRWLMGLFDGDLELVLAAYNAGEQAVINAGCRVPAYPETQAYVKRILQNLERQHGAAPRARGAYAFGCA